MSTVPLTPADSPVPDPSSDGFGLVENALGALISLPLMKVLARRVRVVVRASTPAVIAWRVGRFFYGLGAPARGFWSYVGVFAGNYFSINMWGETVAYISNAWRARFGDEPIPKVLLTPIGALAAWYVGGVPQATVPSEPEAKALAEQLVQSIEPARIEELRVLDETIMSDPGMADYFRQLTEAARQHSARPRRL